MSPPDRPGKVASLSAARKSRARIDKRRQADANAAKHGRTLAQRKAEAAAAARAKALLDSHGRDPE